MSLDLPEIIPRLTRSMEEDQKRPAIRTGLVAGGQREEILEPRGDRDLPLKNFFFLHRSRCWGLGATAHPGPSGHHREEKHSHTPHR